MGADGHGRDPPGRDLISLHWGEPHQPIRALGVDVDRIDVSRSTAKGADVMSAIRRAEVAWSGDLPTGSGTVSAISSNAFADLPVSWAARTESPGGKTSPEELIAAALASCFAMAFSGDLGRAGTPPERLDVSADITFDKTDAGWRVVSGHLTVSGVVPGMAEADFVAGAEKAKDGCPVSQALKGNVALSVDATLAS
jgi:osmotically inducible protein OsmC